MYTKEFMYDNINKL